MVLVVMVSLVVTISQVATVASQDMVAHTTHHHHQIMVEMITTRTTGIREEDMGVG